MSRIPFKPPNLNAFAPDDTLKRELLALKDARIAELEDRIMKLEEVLRPFADAAKNDGDILHAHSTDYVYVQIARMPPNSYTPIYTDAEVTRVLLIYDFRRAAYVLGSKKDE